MSLMLFGCQTPAMLAVGAEFSQQKCIGSHADLEALFVKTWSERWMRHADVPAERWEVIVAFARNHLPRLNLQWPSIGVAEYPTGSQK